MDEENEGCGCYTGAWGCLMLAVGIPFMFIAVKLMLDVKPPSVDPALFANGFDWSALPREWKFWLVGGGMIFAAFGGGYFWYDAFLSRGERMRDRALEDIQEGRTTPFGYAGEVVGSGLAMAIITAIVIYFLFFFEP